MYQEIVLFPARKLTVFLHNKLSKDAWFIFVVTIIMLSNRIPCTALLFNIKRNMLDPYQFLICFKLEGPAKIHYNRS